MTTNDVERERLTVRVRNYGEMKDVELDMAARTGHVDTLTATDLGNNLLIASKPKVKLRLAPGEERELCLAYTAVQRGRYRVLTCDDVGGR